MEADIGRRISLVWHNFKRSIWEKSIDMLGSSRRWSDNSYVPWSTSNFTNRCCRKINVNQAIAVIPNNADNMLQ
jgi:hypothetical protein